MGNKVLSKDNGKYIGILSICMPIIVFLMILNWLFKITPYQTLQGMALLIAPVISIIGFILAYITFKKSPNSLAKWGMAINIILFVSPFIYWIGGTLIFGV